MKWLMWSVISIFLVSSVVADENFKTLKFSDSEQFYNDLEETAFLKKTNLEVVTDFTHPEEVPSRLRSMVNLEEHEDTLVADDGSFKEGAKTTAILTFAGASLASAIGTGVVVGSAFVARSAAAGAAIGAAGGPVAPATIAIAAGVGAVVGFTIGVTVW